MKYKIELQILIIEYPAMVFDNLQVKFDSFHAK